MTQPLSPVIYYKTRTSSDQELTPKKSLQCSCQEMKSNLSMVSDRIYSVSSPRAISVQSVSRGSGVREVTVGDIEVEDSLPADSKEQRHHQVPTRKEFLFRYIAI